jgi:hypothetical protein
VTASVWLAAGQKFYDRDESSKTSGAVFSPGSVATFNFCGETSVTTFGGKASVLGAVLAKADTGSSAFTNGWGVVNTPNPAGAPTANIGLPIIGSSFIKLTNAAANCRHFWYLWYYEWSSLQQVSCDDLKFAGYGLQIQSGANAPLFFESIYILAAAI